VSQRSTEEGRWRRETLTIPAVQAAANKSFRHLINISAIESNGQGIVSPSTNCPSIPVPNHVVPPRKINAHCPLPPHSSDPLFHRKKFLHSYRSQSKILECHVRSIRQPIPIPGGYVTLLRPYIPAVSIIKEPRATHRKTKYDFSQRPFFIEPVRVRLKSETCRYPKRKAIRFDFSGSGSLKGTAEKSKETDVDIVLSQALVNCDSLVSQLPATTSDCGIHCYE